MACGRKDGSLGGLVSPRLNPMDCGSALSAPRHKAHMPAREAELAVPAYDLYAEALSAQFPLNRLLAQEPQTMNLLHTAIQLSDPAKTRYLSSELPGCEILLDFYEHCPIPPPSVPLCVPARNTSS